MRPRLSRSKSSGYRSRAERSPSAVRQGHRSSRGRDTESVGAAAFVPAGDGPTMPTAIEQHMDAPAVIARHNHRLPSIFPSPELYRSTTC